MTKSFKKNLARLANVTVSVSADNIPDDEGSASIVVNFSDGTVLKASYWRFIQNRRAILSSFDHQKKYGLPAPINAKQELCEQLDAKNCVAVQFDRETADLILIFGEDSKLQIFNFTGYEIWEINFPDGTGEYSNCALYRSTP